MIKTRRTIKRIVSACRYVSFCFIVFFSFSLSGQTKKITGQVIDTNKQSVIGANVSVKGESNGTVTNNNGYFTLKVSSGSELVISYLGYKTQEIRITDQSSYLVILEEEEIGLNEVVVVGYGTQRKVTLTGAVAGAKGSEMIKTKNENVQNMLTGKISGVRVWQKSAEPGSFNNSFDIRGMGSPLVVIDGVPRDVGDFQRLNPADINDISVLKDASASIYGVRGANGVVIVTTKKGTEAGKAKINYNGSYTVQQPSRMPALLNPYETMTLYNEKSLNNVNGGSIVYTEADFNAFRDGTRRTTDWNSLIFANTAPQTQHDINISGGNERTKYYISLGYLYQEGFFKSGDLNYDRTNLRSNITTDIAKGLSLNLNIGGMIDQQNTPYSSSTDIIRNYWRQGVLFPAYADAECTMLNYEGLDLEENTVAKMTSNISGYKKYNRKNIQTSADLTYDWGSSFSFLKGLSTKFLYSFDYGINDNTEYRKEYYQYAYDKLTESYHKKLYSPSSPSCLGRYMYTKQQNLWQLLFNYDRSFGRHNLSAMAGLESQKRIGDNFSATRELAFATDYLFAGVAENQKGEMSTGNNDLYEYAYSSFIGRLNYNYSNRYIAELQFRYDGSSKFAPGHQWGFFPSGSIGWRISEEPIFKSIDFLRNVDQLKLRASYGELGDDSDAASFGWLTGYIYPATSTGADIGYRSWWVPGYVFDGKFVNTVLNLPLPNELTTWMTSRTFNIGIDFQAWNGLFGFTLDYFDRHRVGIFQRQSVALPTVVGATAPQENINSDRNFGLELELTHNNRIGDFIYRVKGIATITRHMYLNAVQNGRYGNSYSKWRSDNLNNRYQGIVFGYESAGRYTNWDDIRTYDIYKERNVLPGDYKYTDWNGDGEINELDAHPIAYDQTPWLNYSLNMSGTYKGFDLSVLLQGSALGSMSYKEPLYSMWGQNGGGALTQYFDRWHPAEPYNDPYDPNLKWNEGHYGFTGHLPYADSEFNTVSTAYLRLKSIELGYTLPRIKTLPSMNLRVFANAYNILTLTKVKFVDPEHPNDELGRLYPLNKTYTMGLTLSF